MNSIQKHLLTLLEEIDEICKKHGIPYVLCGRTAKDACRDHKFLGDYVYASVLMRSNDFFKFRRIVKKIPGKTRAVESIMDYPDFPDGRSMRYVDEETTFMYGHTAHKYHHNGIYITIQQCRGIPSGKIAKKFVKAFDKAINLGSVVSTVGMGRKKSFAVKVFRFCSKLFGPAAFTRMLIRMQNLFIKHNSKSLAYIRKGKKDIILPASMMKNIKLMTLEGVKLAVPNDYTKFVNQVFGSGWADNNKEEEISSPHLLVASTDVSYRDIKTNEVLSRDRRDVERMINERDALSTMIKSKRVEIEKNWDVLFMTRERYRLFFLYKPIENILSEKLANEEFEWLELVMNDYLETIKMYIPKGWPVQVSPMLDAIALEMLKRSGDVVAAQKFVQMLTTVTLKPICVELDEKARAASMDNLLQIISGSQKAEKAEETVAVAG